MARKNSNVNSFAKGSKKIPKKGGKGGGKLNSSVVGTGKARPGFKKGKGTANKKSA